VTQENRPTVSRRDVVRLGGVLAAGAVVGGAVVSGGAHAADIAKRPHWSPSPSPSKSPSPSPKPSPSPSPSPSSTDWSRKVVDSTLARYPSANDIGGWSYPVALYLYGQYLVYKRTGNAAYLTYIKAWADRFVDSTGAISNSFSSLDSMLPGNILVILYKETGDTRYKTAAAKIRNRLKTYPRTSDGGFWHATSRTSQLWADGVFMVNPFLIRYGHQIAEAAYTDDETTKQILVYYSHLKSTVGLLYHAYDESAAQTWAVPPDNHSSYFWCRAIGWFGMATIDILELLPVTHPNRAALIAVVRDLAAGFKRYQDPTTGRWYQVVDKPTTSGNWLETSGSSMYSFLLSRGVQRGYLDAATYGPTATKGRNGVLNQLSVDSTGKTNLTNICEGTNVGSLSYYLARQRLTNDFHGLGAFLIMNEQFTHPPA
jgi:unsaturated rhamnogalacturonyl hydrolase